VRETLKPVHLIVNGEEIVTTEGHPFYVKEIGFVNASELSEGDILTDSEGREMPVQSVSTEVTDELIKVYNFQVEEYCN
jgi:intein/homing endonuclease